MNHQIESNKLLKVIRKRKLPEFNNLPEICRFVSNVVKKEYGLVSDESINRGYCFIWAYLVWALSKESVKFATTDGHVVIDDGNLVYDSENPDGVELSVMFYHSDLDSIAEVDVRGMAWYWARCGVYKKEFRSVLRKTFTKLYNKIRAGGFNDHDPYYSDMLCVEDIPN